MIDINLIINDPNLILAKLASRGYKLDVNLITKLHEERKSLINSKESIAANKNKLNDKFRDAKSEDEKNLIKIESQKLEKSILENKNLLEKKEQDLKDIILEIPNIPSEEAPVGIDESFNKVSNSFGSLKKSDVEHSSILSKTEASVDFCAATTVRVIEVITKATPNAQVTFPRALIPGLPVIPPPPPPPPIPSPPPSDLWISTIQIKARVIIRCIVKIIFCIFTVLYYTWACL